MKKLLFILCSFSLLLQGCGNDEMKSEVFVYRGTVVEKKTGAPMEGIPVVLTNGEKIQSSVTTNNVGVFRIEFDVYKINASYYILVGGDNTSKKIVEIRDFSSAEVNLGVIELEGPDVPIVRLDGYEVGDLSVICSATIESDGYKEIDEKGFCVGLEPKPTVSSKKFLCGSGKESFNKEIRYSDLEKSSTYYARPYAINSLGVGYGEEFSFTTRTGVPTVETIGAKNIKESEATVGGRLVSDGGFKVTERGVCWDTDGAPSIEKGHKYINGDDNDEYWIDIAGLEANIKYYACAYAKNTNGVSYGKLIEFTTNPDKATVLMNSATNISYNGATLSAVVQSAGVPVYTECGFCYSKHKETSVNDKKVRVNHSGVGEYSYSIKDLDVNAIYYARAYLVWNGKVEYSSEIEFTTRWEDVGLVMNNASAVSYNSATLSAVIQNVGSPEYTECGFCYAKHENPTVDDNRVRVSHNGAGEYSTRITNLDKDATYYVKAYAVQDGVVKYSSKITFSTRTEDVSFIMNNASSVSYDAATISAIIQNAGSPEYTECGFCYAKHENPTVDDKRVRVSFSGAGEYSTRITNLDKDATYYVKAYAVQDGEVKYSSAINFRTIWEDAVVSITSVTDVEETTATIKARVTNPGTPSYEEKGICWSSTSEYPTIDMDESKRVSTTTFECKLSGLSPATRYYARAYVKQEGKVVYSDRAVFTTIQNPSVVTLDVSNVSYDSSQFLNSVSATLNGAVQKVGSPAYTQRGFVYGTYATPTHSNGTVVVVSGTGVGDFSKTIKVNNYDTYYVRAFVKTSNGYVYGETVSFEAYY